MGDPPAVDLSGFLMTLRDFTVDMADLWNEEVMQAVDRITPRHSLK